MKTIYLAGPLFSNAERQWNVKLRNHIEQVAGFKVLLPQEMCMGLNPANNGDEDALKLFRICEKGVRDADIILAVLDNADVDSGTAWEVGYARGIGKKVIGVRTDFRLCEFYNVNIMLKFGVDEIVTDFSGNDAELFEKIILTLNKYLKA
jgi:nucleoside 2-deoxyribosyltransferase